MKILHVSNRGPHCGIANFAEQFDIALRRAGHEVTAWNGNYPVLYAGQPYLPENVGSYDVVHYNWHPGTLNHYRPEHLPPPAHLVSTGSYSMNVKRPIRSIYLHDLPPFSGLDWADQCEVRMTSEPHALSTLVAPYPCGDWVEGLDTAPTETFRVGISSVRGDGAAIVRGVCMHQNWTLTEPDPEKWLSYDDEVRRMSTNTVNVVWYWEARGKSGGLAQAVSAGRPVVCNDSPMCSHFDDSTEILRVPEKWPGVAALEHTLAAMYQRWQDGMLGGWTVWETKEAHSWTRAAAQMTAAWEEARQG